MPKKVKLYKFHKYHNINIIKFRMPSPDSRPKCTSAKSKDSERCQYSFCPFMPSYGYTIPKYLRNWYSQMSQKGGHDVLAYYKKKIVKFPGMHQQQLKVAVCK